MSNEYDNALATAWLFPRKIGFDDAGQGVLVNMDYLPLPFHAFRRV
jgi:hypothetical protein